MTHRGIPRLRAHRSPKNAGRADVDKGADARFCRFSNSASVPLDCMHEGLTAVGDHVGLMKRGRVNDLGDALEGALDDLRVSDVPDVSVKPLAFWSSPRAGRPLA